MILTSDQIKELNAQYSSGTFFEGLVVVRDQQANPVVKDYFANCPDAFELGGNTYLPLGMVFPDQKNDASMSMPIARCALLPRSLRSSPLPHPTSSRSPRCSVTVSSTSAL